MQDKCESETERKERVVCGIGATARPPEKNLQMMRRSRRVVIPEEIEFLCNICPVAWEREHGMEVLQESGGDERRPVTFRAEIHRRGILELAIHVAELEGTCVKTSVGDFGDAEDALDTAFGGG
jgi:hypothetical protein